MSANESYELAVQLRGEGIDETTQQVDNVGDSFEESAATVGDSADEMEGFASRWSGAISSIMVGLAVAAGGLASQVPVIGGLMSGLNSIISAVAFQIDQILRPVLQPVADAFFRLSDAIFNAEGPLGDIIGILGTAAIVLGALGGAAFVAKSIFGGLGALLAAVSTPLLALGAIMVGVAALMITSGKEIKQVLTRNIDELRKSFGQLTNFLRAAFTPVLQAAMRAGRAAASLITGVMVPALQILIQTFDLVTDIMAGDWSGAWQSIKQITRAEIDLVINAITGMAKFIKSIFGGLVDIAFQWGRDLLVQFADGIAAAASAPVDAAKGALGGIKNAISFDQAENDRMARKWGKDLLTEFSVGMSEGASSVDMSINAESGGSGGGGRPASRDNAPQVFLDGRRVDGQQRKRRGRPRRARQRDGT